jgi:hypothetical protein
MALHRSLIAIIAKQNPSIWEEIIGPLGPLRRFDAVALNPQPLPPIARAALNPQPLPPGVEYGTLVGAELVRAAGLAQLLHLPFDLVAEEICPPPRKWPPIPFPPAPWPPRGDDFDLGYAIGLAYALESSAHAWQHLDGAGALEGVHEAAFATAERQMG